MIESSFPFRAELRKSFRAGSLGREWAARYAHIFDGDDVRLLKTQHQRNYHFFEWLAAVLIFESTGMISLVQKYMCANHPRKINEIKRVLPSDVAAFVLDWDESGAPDLFVYSPERKDDWFFCEVKGPSDRFRSHQREFARELRRLSGRDVHLLNFIEV